jgi:hypothetical protein
VSAQRPNRIKRSRTALVCVPSTCDLHPSSDGIPEFLWYAVDYICSQRYILPGSSEWELEVTPAFNAWWAALTEREQERVGAVIDLLERHGPALGFPFSTSVVTSRHSVMRELRAQHAGRPYRVLYAFDRRRIGLLLVGGEKRGDDRWYERMVPLADRLYDDHLATLTRDP